MKITKVAMTSVLLGLSSFVLAQESNQVKEKHAKPAPTYSPYLGDKLPPYNNPNRFLLQTSFIYWQADVDGLDYGLEQNLQSTGTTVTTGGTSNTVVTASDSMQNKGLSFKWDPGFKAGVGVIFGEMDEWDLVLNWTWLQSKAHRRQNLGNPASFGLEATVGDTTTLTNNTTLLNPSYSTTFLDSPAVSASNKWRMHYNTLDLELGRNFYIAKSLSLRPNIGLRGAWIHQLTKVGYELASLNASYTPLTTLSPTAVDFPSNMVGSSQFKGKNNYNAVGVRGGFDMRWNFTNHFCVYSTLAGAIMYGQFKIEENFDSNYNITPLATGGADSPVQVEVNASLDNSYHRTRTNLQAILGLLWHTSFYNDKHHLTVSAGYEVNEWFQQNELRVVDGDQGGFPLSIQSYRTNGDLGLHGLTVDLKYDF